MLTCFTSKALEAKFFLSSVLGGVSVEFGKLGRFLEILPGALGTNFQSAVRVRSPAVVPFVEEVVGVAVVGGLDAVVARAVEPSLALETLRESATELIVSHDLEHTVCRHNQLKAKDKIRKTEGIGNDEGLHTRRVTRGRDTFYLVICLTTK